MEKSVLLRNKLWPMLGNLLLPLSLQKVCVLARTKHKRKEREVEFVFLGKSGTEKRRDLM